MKMNACLKNVLKALVYKFTFQKKYTLVFTSYDGHYSDSPKRISEKIHEINSKYHIVWLIKPEYSKNIPDYVQWVDIDSLKAQKIRGQAAALIDNVYCSRAYIFMDNSLLNHIKGKIFSILYNKKNQPGFTTFHGTAVKKIGREQVGNEKICDFICPNVTMILGNKFSIDIMKHVTFGKIDMKLLGSPRNDILFKNAEQLELKQKLKIPNNKKIALFAPTFRNDGKDVEGKNVWRSGLQQLEEIDFNKLFGLLNIKFGGEWVFICRFHYHVANMVDWKKLDEISKGRIVNGNLHDNMEDYLACSDLLITDASSCSMDFALTHRPCFLFFPDYDNYKNKERGFTLDIEKLPFPLTTTFDDMMNAIKNFDIDMYKQEIDAMLENMGYVDDQNSSDRVARYIVKMIEKRK